MVKRICLLQVNCMTLMSEVGLWYVKAVGGSMGCAGSNCGCKCCETGQEGDGDQGLLQDA